MRLIDEDKLLSDLKACAECKRQDNTQSEYFKLSELEFIISEQSTSYDVDKVVEQIKQHIKAWEDKSMQFRRDIADERIKALKWVLSIVKGGGQGE